MTIDTTTTDDEVSTVTTTTRTLTAQDRCDHCRSQAYVVTEHEAGELMWCGHCMNKYETALLPFITLDNRAALLHNTATG